MINPLIQSVKQLCFYFSGNDVASIAPSGGAFCHNTTSIRRYSVDSGNFDLCDTWGLNSNNYRDEHKILPALLEGWLPNGWTMHDHIRGQFNRVMANSTSQHQRKVHGVLFFMTAGAVHDEEKMDIAARSFRKVCFTCSFAVKRLPSVTAGGQ